MRVLPLEFPQKGICIYCKHLIIFQSDQKTINSHIVHDNCFNWFINGKAINLSRFLKIIDQAAKSNRG